MSSRQDPTDHPQKRYVTCPCCGGPSLYSPDNAFRPFCSKHCKSIDLGAWASERFTLPLTTPPDPSDPNLP